MTDAVEVRVAGTRISAFTRGTLQFSFGSPTADFDVEYLLPRNQTERAVFEGDPVQVLIGGHVVIDGYVDGVDDDDSPTELRMRASGRSKSMDLADCSMGAARFHGVTVGTLARQLAQPFGVAVEVDGDEGDPLPNFAVQRGETPGEAIVRAAELRGMHVYARGAALVVGRAKTGSADVQLVRGQAPLIRTGRSSTWFQRFSTYVYKGQLPSTDTAWGKDAHQLSGSVVDPAITRYRPQIVQIGSTGGQGGDLKSRAEVVRNQRAGLAQRVTCTCLGLTRQDGQPWTVNTLVGVRNPVLALDDVLLVSQVRCYFGATQTVQTELELVPPGAFDVGKVRALNPHTRVRWSR